MSYYFDNPGGLGIGESRLRQVRHEIIGAGQHMSPYFVRQAQFAGLGYLGADLSQQLQREVDTAVGTEDMAWHSSTPSGRAAYAAIRERFGGETAATNGTGNYVALGVGALLGLALAYFS